MLYDVACICGFRESAVEKKKERKKQIQVFFTSPFSDIWYISDIMTVFPPSIPILKLCQIMLKYILLYLYFCEIYHLKRN